MDKEKLDEITTVGSVAGGLRKDTLPNDEDTGITGETCYCPVCKKPRNKANNDKSCGELYCPECNSVLTDFEGDAGE